MADLTEVFCSGGGVNSAAITALIVQGKLPKPAFAVIADTERERPAVWEYHKQVIEPELSKIEVKIYRISKGQFATVDLWSKGKGGTTLPVYLANGGRSMTLCSNEWKRRVIDRFCRSIGVKKSKRWLGLTLEEGRRYTRWKLGEDGIKGLVRFPLIEDVPLTRKGCLDVVAEMGWPQPPRSACWMCPHQTNKEWRDLKLNWPEKFAEAVRLEKELQQKEPYSFLNPARIPLSEIDFGNEDDLFAGGRCDSGMCFT